MKECQRVYIIVPWSINWYAPGKSYAIDGFCCDYKGHVPFSNGTQTISWVQEHAVPYGSVEDVLFGMYGKHSKEWGTTILRLYPIGFSCFLLRNWCNSMLWSGDKELRHKCQYHNTVCALPLSKVWTVKTPFDIIYRNVQGYIWYAYNKSANSSQFCLRSTIWSITLHVCLPAVHRCKLNACVGFWIYLNLDSGFTDSRTVT